MDDLLAQTRAAHENVKTLQRNGDQPFKTILDAFVTYRTAIQSLVLADVLAAEKFELQLWAQHVETRQILARTLRELRKRQSEETVEVKVATEMYTRFLRHSIRFYRSFVQQLAQSLPSIPALGAIARQFSSSNDVSSRDEIYTAQVIDKATRTCYRSLVYLGDLSRYRASDILDKTPDFGPAIGYYNLAFSLRPEAGWCHNQQAIVAIETKACLRALFHLYRSIVVAEPVPAAKKSLLMHLEKSNAAWEKGELIEKLPASDPEAGKRAVIGLFVRLHSVCASGSIYRGYDELERELITRVEAELTTRSPGQTLIRMVLTNTGAQYLAMHNYRESQTTQHEQTFYYHLRINIVFFRALSDLFRDELLRVAANHSLDDAPLEHKLQPTMIRILPALRLYGCWVLLNSHLLLGLARNDFLRSPIEEFWNAYAQTLDLIATVFPIWDLEDVDPVEQMLPEDVDAKAFLAIDSDQAPSLVRKIFRRDNPAARSLPIVAIPELDARETDMNLLRILSFLEMGSFMANDVEGSPIFIRGTRFSHGENAALFNIPLPPRKERLKPLSYAAAARPVKPQKSQVHNPPARLDFDSVSSAGNPDVHLMRMVDSLVDDEDTDHPVTPPQQFASNPAVVRSFGEHHESPSLASSPKIDIDTLHPSVMPASLLLSSTRPQARSRVNEDLSDFSPRPSRPSSAQLWTPGSPRVGSPAVQKASPVVTQGKSRQQKHTRASSANKTQNGVQLAHRGARERHDPPSMLHSPRSGTALTKNIPNSAGLPSPLLFGGKSIWTSSPGPKPESGD